MAVCPTCHASYESNVRICPTDGTPLPVEPQADPNVGSMLESKYRIDGFISAGGMGSVYRGTHVMLDKVVAIKLIRKELVTSPDIAQRFQREARAASNLGHPNIAAVNDFGQTADGTLYLVMEYIKGPSLRDVIQRSGPMAPERIIDILQPVAAALARAHRSHIIHRDLKPHNIMLDVDADGRETPKLLDFGIAKTFDDSASQLTMTGFALGTPQYMSPEQATGKAVDGRTDIYSFGVVLYEMLVGEVPFSDTSMAAILLKQMTDAPVPPSVRKPGLRISPTLEAIAMRCLEKDPANRFQSADDLISALDTAKAQLSAADEATRVPIPVAPGDPTTANPRGTTPTRQPTTNIAGLAGMPTATAAPVSPATAGRAATSVTAGGTGAISPPPTPEVPAPAQGPVQPPTPGTTPTIVAPLAAMSATKAARKSNSALWLTVIAVVAIGLLGVGLWGLRSRTSSTATQEAAVTAPSSTPAMAQPSGSPEPASTTAPSNTPPTEPTSPAASAPPAPENLPATSTVSTDRAASDVPSGANSSSSTAQMAPAPTAPPATTAPTGTTAPTVTSGRAGASASTARAAAAAPSGLASASAPPPSTGTPVAPARAAAAAQAAPPAQTRGENPTVSVQCNGPGEVCTPMRSAFSEAITRDHMIPAAGGRADVVLAITIEIIEERVQQSFGSTFLTRTYSAEVSGEARGAAVPMPDGRTFSFDARVGRERATENARLLAADAVEKVRAFWDRGR
jgi:serine/threonine-protein kinase